MWIGVELTTRHGESENRNFVDVYIIDVRIPEMGELPTCGLRNGSNSILNARPDSLTVQHTWTFFTTTKLFSESFKSSA